MILFVSMYWHYAITYAPTQELSEELSRKDGAPMTAVFAIGWIYVVVYVFIIEFAKFILNWISRKIKRA